MNPSDSPPTTCGYNDAVDCKDGKCAVRAVTNFTRRSVCGIHSSTFRDQEEAIKFLIHIVSDLTQPLHVCSRGWGGNTAKINFDGRVISLHAAWDSAIPSKRLNQYFNTKYEYAHYLVRQLTQGGLFEDVHESWLVERNPFRISPNGNSLMAIEWAQDSAQHNCGVVWKPYDLDPTQDFGADYYTNAISVVDMQMLKAAKRLAFLLDRVYLSCNVLASFAVRRRTRK